MKHNLFELYRLMPGWAFTRLIESALAGTEIHLNLHRVRSSISETDPLADASIAPEKLDRLLDLLVGDSAKACAPHVVASFDDGYADAVDYAVSRNARFPTVDWMFFVCPARIRDRIAYRWDYEEVRGSDAGGNGSESVSGLADSQEYRLATADELRHLASLPRVRLGNHTNSHVPLSTLDPHDCAAEIDQSKRDFEELFGPTEHFAFPFGSPGLHFRREHVEMLRAAGYRFLYTTEPRPAAASSGGDVTLIPRFGLMGTWPAEKFAFRVAAGTVKHRLRPGRRKLA